MGDSSRRGCITRSAMIHVRLAGLACDSSRVGARARRCSALAFRGAALHCVLTRTHICSGAPSCDSQCPACCSSALPACTAVVGGVVARGAARNSCCCRRPPHSPRLRAAVGASRGNVHEGGRTLHTAAAPPRATRASDQAAQQQSYTLHPAAPCNIRSLCHSMQRRSRSTKWMRVALLRELVVRARERLQCGGGGEYTMLRRSIFNVHGGDATCECVCDGGDVVEECSARRVSSASAWRRVPPHMCPCMWWWWSCCCCCCWWCLCAASCAICWW